MEFRVDENEIIRFRERERVCVPDFPELKKILEECHRSSLNIHREL